MQLNSVVKYSKNLSEWFLSGYLFLFVALYCPYSIRYPTDVASVTGYQPWLVMLLCGKQHSRRGGG